MVFVLLDVSVSCSYDLVDGVELNGVCVVQDEGYGDESVSLWNSSG